MAEGVKRIHVLGLPLDVVDSEHLQEAIESLYSLQDHRSIILLDFNSFMRSRFSSERRAALDKAALVLPVAPILAGAARFLKKDVPSVWRPYSFIIRLLGILELKNRSVYLLGSSMKGVRQAESTLKKSFPGLQIVGRYSASFPAGMESNIITAVKKSSPSLLLSGKGLKGKWLWLSRKSGNFAPGLSIYEKHCFNVFSGKRSKPNENPAARFLGRFLLAFILPWRLLRIFSYLLFYFMLLVDRLKKK